MPLQADRIVGFRQWAVGSFVASSSSSSKELQDCERKKERGLSVKLLLVIELKWWEIKVGRVCVFKGSITHLKGRS
jgi:hypothetical protein